MIITRYAIATIFLISHATLLCMEEEGKKAGGASESQSPVIVRFKQRSNPNLYADEMPLSMILANKKYKGYQENSEHDNNDFLAKNGGAEHFNVIKK